MARSPGRRDIGCAPVPARAIRLKDSSQSTLEGVRANKCLSSPPQAIAAGPVAAQLCHATRTCNAGLTVERAYIPPECRAPCYNANLNPGARFVILSSSVGKERLELSRTRGPHDPKSCPSTNSGTPPNTPVRGLSISSNAFGLLRRQGGRATVTNYIAPEDGADRPAR